MYILKEIGDRSEENDQLEDIKAVIKFESPVALIFTHITDLLPFE